MEDNSLNFMEAMLLPFHLPISHIFVQKVSLLYDRLFSEQQQKQSNKQTPRSSCYKGKLHELRVFTATQQALVIRFLHFQSEVVCLRWQILFWKQKQMP